MATHIQKGDVLQWTNDTGSDVSSGALVKIGNRAGVCIADIASGVAGAVALAEAWELTKATGVGFQVGDDVWMDEDDGKVTEFSAGASVYVGKIIEAAGTAATTCKVLLGDPGPGAGAGGGGGGITYFEDFFGLAAAITNREWDVVDVGAATEAEVADTHGGEFALTLTSASEAQDAVLYHGDQLNFDITKLKRFACRLKVSAEPGTLAVAVWGMASAHDLDKDTVAFHAWFRLQASLDLLVENDDDGSVTSDDNDTLIDLVVGVYHLFEIDFSDLSDVKFYVDGIRQLASTTFDLSAASTKLQPYFSLDKPASESSLGAITVDWVRITASR